ncbi:MAG: hypothetical protein DRJ65_16805 [Acidobacteria bacterium]|nr:MAG: hypothetical protein DRJ65_16805 [Acidobacteriota bacterium]
MSYAMPLPRIAPPLPRTIRLAQGGDDPAREELAVYCRKIAYIFALQGCGDRHEAHDLAQDAVLRFFAALDRFHTDRPVKPWLLTITRNLIRDRARRQRTRRIEAFSLADIVVEPSDPEPGPEAIAALHQMQQLLWRSMQELSASDREIVTLREYLDLSYEDIANALGVPRGTVMSRLHRARRRLGAIMTHRKQASEGEVHDA